MANEGHTHAAAILLRQRFRAAARAGAPFDVETERRRWLARRVAAERLCVLERWAAHSGGGKDG